LTRVRSSPFSTERNDTRWVDERVEELEAPLLVCEPVRTEAMYLLGRYSRAQDVLFELLQNGALNVAFRIEEHVGALRKLLQKYRDTPMSLADACVVRMAEIHERHAVLTLDADFSVYRKHGRIPLTLIHPAGA
jgi:predicted nucleic acid-binding protein